MSWASDHDYAGHIIHIRDYTCKYCGKGRLDWHEQDDGKWVLVKDGTTEKHICRKVEK